MPRIASLTLLVTTAALLCAPAMGQAPPWVDVLGDMSNVPTGTALGKGLSYDITVPVILTQAEFYLQFSDTQTLGFYVYSCPTEYGVYNQIWTASNSITGSGAGWYSTGPISVPMNVGTHYIIAVSWSGTVTYFFGVGDSQLTTFGSETNAYAAGSHPMGPTISSLGNDSAIYHQRITTVPQNPPAWQLNSAEASFDIDGAQLGNAYVQTGAQVTTSPYGFSTATVASSLVGNGHDILVGFMPTVAAGSGGFGTPGGQFVNVDLLDPFVGFLYGSGLIPGLPAFTGNYSVPVVPYSPLLLSAQVVFLNPAHPDSISLSQAVQYNVISCSPQENFDALPLGPSTPTGWTNPSAGVAWTVHTNGTTSTGTGPTSASSPPNYMYCETSGSNTNANFVMDTCNFDVTQLTNFTLNFSLSRIGATTGTLIIWQDDGGLGTFSTQLTTYSGADPNQMQGGTEWSQESITFVPTTAAVAFRFDYLAGGGFTGDLAIDDFSVQ